MEGRFVWSGTHGIDDERSIGLRPGIKQCLQGHKSRQSGLGGKCLDALPAAGDESGAGNAEIFQIAQEAFGDASGSDKGCDRRGHKLWGRDENAEEAARGWTEGGAVTDGDRFKARSGRKNGGGNVGGSR